MRKSVHVTYKKSDGKWHVVMGDSNRSSGNFETQKAAIPAGRKVAMETSSEFLIHGKDGKIRLATSYGNDPRPTSTSTSKRSKTTTSSSTSKSKPTKKSTKSK